MTPTRPELLVRYVTGRGSDLATAVRRMELMRSRRTWPPWCYVPTRIVAQEMAGASKHDTYIMSAFATNMAAWRIGKGLYQFDASLLHALASTPLIGALPVEVLHKMPEFCVYVELNQPTCRGFFARLDWDPVSKDTIIMLLLDCLNEDMTHGTFQIAPISLTPGVPFAECIAAPREHQEPAHAPLSPADLGCAVQALLYICSENADMQRLGPGPKQPKRRGRKPHAAAQHVTVWDVGVRIGAALGAARQAQGNKLGGSHASPRAHVRRAHWHTYLTGPRDGQQRPVLRWIPPILIGSGDTVPTIHKARGPES